MRIAGGGKQRHVHSREGKQRHVASRHGRPPARTQDELFNEFLTRDTGFVAGRIVAPLADALDARAKVRS
jgi:hypothetical protein